MGPDGLNERDGPPERRVHPDEIDVAAELDEVFVGGDLRREVGPPTTGFDRIEHHHTGVPGLSGQIDPEDAHTVNLRRIVDGVRRGAGTWGGTIAARTRGRR